MKKFLLAMVLMAGTLFSYAQNIEISGKVTSADDGSGLPGVSVAVQGTSRGTTTDSDGMYKISASKGSTLVFSFVGMITKTVEIKNQTTLNVVLDSDANQLSEVVVTGAYGTKQTGRSAVFSAQVINNDQLNTIRQSNFNNALAGKVAGIQVRSQSAAALGRQTEVRLRGVSGFGAGGGALYVVDGTILPNIDDINNDDIESISILQGPAAAAQFGSQGANGAIVISMKKARQQQGLGVTLNMGVQFDKVYILPNYQNSYAGGGAGELSKYTWKATDPVEWKVLDGKYYHDYSDDASWGPRMVGQEYIPWYSWYGGHDKSFTTAKLTPQPTNAKDYFETGVFTNNSITINKAYENLLFKVTYGNQYTNGLLPTSSLSKNTLNVNAVYDINKYLELTTNINYANTVRTGQIDDGYSSQSTGSFNQWFHRDLDMGIMKELKDLRTPEGWYASWNKANPNSFDPANTRAFYAGNYWYNFYSFYDMMSLVNSRDRLFGDIALKYKINKDISVKATYRKQQTTTWYEDKYSSDLKESATQTTGNCPECFGYYGTGNLYSNRENLELIGTYNKKIGAISVDGFVGTDFFKWTYKANEGNTNQGLSVPNLYTLANSVNSASIFNSRTNEAYNAIFAKASVGYKNFFFLDGTVRKDWFSTLNPENNGVISKSLGFSFVFSDFIKESLPWMSLGKIRGSWGEIPKALGTSNETFGAYRYPGMAYGVGQFKWGSNFLMGTPDQVVDPNIAGSVASQKEIGLDLEFLKGKYGLSFTYWDGSEIGFPYALTVNGASGFSSVLTNIGKIAKQGIELKLNAEVLNIKNFKWNVIATYADLIKNDVVELSKEYEVTQTSSQGDVWGSTMPYLLHQEGRRWGQIFGNGAKRINGVPVVNSDGTFVNDPNVNFGSVVPRYTGGLQNSFSIFKNFIVNANIDYQFGGKFVSLSNMWGSYSGLTAQTATVNDKGNPIRDAVADGGGVHVSGVNAEGKPVDYYVEGQDYFHGLYNNKIFDSFVYDLTFVKLRELSVGYGLPVNKLGLSKYVNNVTLSVVSRNPFLIYAKTKDFDPSEISATVGETAQLPGTRSLGVNLRIGF
ncbi:MAG: SusC/RagA family TonB-linked outer membrane protein [Cytophagaceae bacterium]|nr:SusC/RagA family TonB-linked outer membrane protein [Cytophagaceae bacterium]